MYKLRRRRSRIAAPTPHWGLCSQGRVTNRGGADSCSRRTMAGETPGAIGLKSNHHRLRLQSHAPNLFHSMLDLFLQSQHLGGRGAAAIHYG